MHKKSHQTRESESEGEFYEAEGEFYKIERATARGEQSILSERKL